MNRKSKIIVSVVGIAIVLLALLGITYAYYLTRIEGNTNSNSISVTTADLKLKYGDGNGLISKSDIMPGTEIIKEFTVSNEGESRVEDYVVVLEQIVNTLTRTTDLKYTLTCELSNGNSCGSTEELTFPSGVEEKAIFLNSIDKDVTHYYTLTVNYINLTETDQSTDMGSSISALVNIKDSKEIDTTGLTNPSEAKILADEIINNAKLNKNGTMYSPTPLTTPAVDISGEEERTLSVTQDNMGTGTSYYFRGSVQDNYVLFNNMCFRIIRIEGDGSVKLIYAGDVSIGATNCNEVGEETGLFQDAVVYGYDENWLVDYENNVGGKEYGYIGLEEVIGNWYTTKFNTTALQDKIKTDKWCLGGNNNYGYDRDGNLYTGQELENLSYYYYSAANRLWKTQTTSLMCENEDYVESKYGTLTVDEVVLAGGTTAENKTYYLYENAQDLRWWTLSYVDTKNAFIVWDFGYLCEEVLDDDRPGARPSITLETGTTIEGGEGTKGNPYVIN